jgi:hypothetical protein
MTLPDFDLLAIFPILWAVQSAEARAARLVKAQEEVQVEDEHIGDKQVFNQLQMEKYSKIDAKANPLKTGHAEGPSLATPEHDVRSPLPQTTLFLYDGTTWM